MEPKLYQFSDEAPLTAYVADMSYFSGKLEAYLKYKEIPFIRKTVDISTLVNHIYANTRMMKVPVVELHDGAWLKDTTPMLEWFDQQKTEFSIYPEDPVTRFLSFLIEDYADEWCWRSALYWRWYFPETKQLIGRRIGYEVLGDWPIPKGLAGRYFAHRQISTYLTGDGVTSETEPYVKKHYTDMLEHLQAILSDSDFLLGDKPSIADFGLFGPFFRHFGLDPAPAKVMIEQAPSVYAWLARMWDAKGSKMSSDAQFNDLSHSGWQYFFKDIAQVYIPFLKANALAWKNGKKRFDLETPEVSYPQLKTVHYRVYCLEMLQKRFAALSLEEQEMVCAMFAPYGNFELGEGVDSKLAGEFKFPIDAAINKPGVMEKLILTATGTPWDLPRWLKSKS